VADWRTKPRRRAGQRSPDGAKRNPGQHYQRIDFPDCAALHPGYEASHPFCA
jgi:hypothetical protein